MDLSDPTEDIITQLWQQTGVKTRLSRPCYAPFITCVRDWGVDSARVAYFIQTSLDRDRLLVSDFLVAAQIKKYDDHSKDLL
jgi:hypothetical protein